MEYVPGGSLRERLAAQKRLPSPRVVEIALDLADAQALGAGQLSLGMAITRHRSGGLLVGTPTTDTAGESLWRFM
jgi:hypothetical protein